MARKRKHAGPTGTTKTAAVSFRDGDTMVETVVTTKTIPAIVDFADILTATEVVPDEEARVPWEDCDGYEHSAVAVNRLDGEKRDRADEMQGYAWSDGDRERVLIELERGDVFKVAEYARANGASKQVAAEMAALERRRTIAILKNWYEHGWEYWGVTCDYLDEHDSLWGIDDSEYAERDVRYEIAGQVAHALQNRGFTIVNEPARGTTRYAKRWNLRRKLGLQSWIETPEEFDRRQDERERIGNETA